MKTRAWLKKILLVLVALVPTARIFGAQEIDGIYLRLVRNFGYGGLGKIQGRFTLKIQDPPSDLIDVEFYMDGALVGTDRDAPFEFKFHTSEFDEGERMMSAVGIMSDGGSVESNQINKVFLSSEQAWSDTEGMLVPLLVGVGLLTLAGAVIPLLVMNKKDFVVGKYGPAGGVVCPRCTLPFSRSVISPNLAVGKLVRCPHCGKISILARSSAGALKEAEARFSEKDGTTPVLGGESFIKQIEDSRFEE